jgi:hypothetical protein
MMDAMTGRKAVSPVLPRAFVASIKASMKRTPSCSKTRIPVAVGEEKLK